MIELLNRLLLGLAAGIFKGVNGCYIMFYGLATTKLFSSDVIQEVANNLYMLVSVVILFAFSIKLIEAIVNPDLLTDGKKGVTGVLKRTIIGLLLIVAVPNIFNLAYYFSSEIITSSLIEKVVLGYTNSDSEGGMDSAGAILTSSIITGFVVPIDENGTPITESSECGDDLSCNFGDRLVARNADYEEYVPFIGGNPDYDKLSKLKIGATWGEDDDAPIYDVSGLLLVAVGIFVFYQVILLCFDTALRLVNLGILEMISPIIIVSYIGGGEEYLSKWAKMTVEKFLSVFIRIAALAFMVLGFRLINDPRSIFANQSYTVWFKILVIIGLLRLVKDMPNLISNIFGVNIKGDGGIKGRLGEMAGIGGLAQKAWTGLGSLAKTGAIAAGAGLAGGIKKAPRFLSNQAKAFKKFGEDSGLTNAISNKWQNSRLGKGVASARNSISSLRQKAANSKAGQAIAGARQKVQNVTGSVKAKLDNSKLAQALKVKLKADASGIMSNIKRIPAGFRVMADGVKSGGKYSSIKESYAKNFSDIAYQDKVYKEQRQAARFYDSVEGALDGGTSGAKFAKNQDGAIDWKNRSTKDAILNAQDGGVQLANDIINGASSITMGSDVKKQLISYNEKVNESNIADLKLENRQNLIQQIESLSGSLSGAIDKAKLETIVTDVKDNKITDFNALQARLDELNFGDKDAGAAVLDGLSSSGVSDAVLIKQKFQNGNYDGTMGSAVLVHDLIQSGAFGDISTATPQKMAEIQKKAEQLADNILNAGGTSAKDMFISQIEEASKADCALGGKETFDELTELARIAAENKQKAADKTDQLIQSLTGATQEQAKQLKSSVDKIHASELSDVKMGAAEIYDVLDSNGNPTGEKRYRKK